MEVCSVDKAGAACQLGALDEVDFEGSSILWVDLVDPGTDELKRVGELFSVHPLALEDVQKLVDIPKLQEFDEHLFILWLFIRDDPETEMIETVGLGAFLGTNYLVTIHKDPLPELDDTRRKLLKEPSLYREGPAAVLYSFLDTSVDEYFPIVEELTDSIEQFMEYLLSESEEAGEVETILRLKHRNMALRKTAALHRDVIVKLLHHDVGFIPESLSVYILDIYDHLARISTQVDGNSDLIASSLDLHQSAVNNRMNVTMKRLTTIATIFLPLTFLVGLWGMNFRHVPEFTWRYGYVLALGVMAVVAIVMIVLAKKKDWF